MFDVDVRGGINLKKLFPQNSLAVFVMPPSVDELRLRLRGRGTDTQESLNVRVNKALEEMQYADQFDAVIVNKQLEVAFSDADKVIDSFIKS